MTIQERVHEHIAKAPEREFYALLLPMDQASSTVFPAKPLDKENHRDKISLGTFFIGGDALPTLPPRLGYGASFA